MGQQIDADNADGEGEPTDQADETDGKRRSCEKEEDFEPRITRRGRMRMGS